MKSIITAEVIAQSTGKLQASYTGGDGNDLTLTLGSRARRRSGTHGEYALISQLPPHPYEHHGERRSAGRSPTEVYRPRIGRNERSLHAPRDRDASQRDWQAADGAALICRLGRLELARMRTMLEADSDGIGLKSYGQPMALRIS